MKITLRAWPTLLVGVVVLVVLAVANGVTWTDLRHLGTSRNALVEEGVEWRIPLPEGPPYRSTPEVDVTTDGSYAFTFEDQGEPVRYDPCRPVEWYHNTTDMPAGADIFVHDAVDQIAAATGLTFDYQGTTTEAVSFERPILADDGQRFAPVVLGWSTPEQSADLEDGVAGVAGSRAVPGAYGEQRYLVNGVVVMNADSVRALMTYPGGRKLATAVVMHEFGHVVGLAHVDDPAELMYEQSLSLTQWGPGDLAGLAIAGAGPCQDP